MKIEPFANRETTFFTFVVQRTPNREFTLLCISDGITYFYGIHEQSGYIIATDNVWKLLP